ncbi:MAG: cold shock domain-containing protein [Thermoplasmatota archaeon]
MKKGTVKKWMTSYGFIDAEGMEDDVFVHASETASGMSLSEGQTVQFEVKNGRRGPKAVSVQLVSETD